MQSPETNQPTADSHESAYPFEYRRLARAHAEGRPLALPDESDSFIATWIGCAVWLIEVVLIGAALCVSASVSGYLVGASTPPNAETSALVRHAVEWIAEATLAFVAVGTIFCVWRLRERDGQTAHYLILGALGVGVMFACAAIPPWLVTV